MPFFHVEFTNTIVILVIPIYCKRFQYCLNIERYVYIMKNGRKGTFDPIGKMHNSTK